MQEQLTPKQAAEMAGVSLRTVYSWIRRGVQGQKLKAKKKQGRVMILKADFDSFIESTTQDM